MGNRDSGDETAERPEPGQDHDHGGYDRTVFSKGQDFARPTQAGLFGGQTPLPRSTDVRMTLHGVFLCVNCHATVALDMSLNVVTRGVKCHTCGISYTVGMRQNLNPPGWEAVEEL